MIWIWIDMVRCEPPFSCGTSSWVSQAYCSHLTGGVSLAPDRIINHLFHYEFEEPLCV